MNMLEIAQVLELQKSLFYIADIAGYNIKLKTQHLVLDIIIIFHPKEAKISFVCFKYTSA